MLLMLNVTSSFQLAWANDDDVENVLFIVYLVSHIVVDLVVHKWKTEARCISSKCLFLALQPPVPTDTVLLLAQ